MVLIAALHGILTRQTDPSWPDKFSKWMYERDPQVHVATRHYWAGPFPRWNCWVKDPCLARGLANELELFLGEPSVRCQVSRVRCQPSEPDAPVSRNTQHATRPSLWLLAHSNGAVIALLAAKRLIARGHRIGGLILTGAACEADLDKNGVRAWCRTGALGAAIAYSSADDEVLDGDPSHGTDPRRSPLATVRSWLWGRLMWPYGCLGRTGWVSSRSRITPHASRPPIFTRWYPGGHTAYFTPDRLEQTFSQIYHDIAHTEGAGPVVSTLAADATATTI
jgi:hypothetical protein